MANDLVFSLGGDISAFERAMAQALISGQKGADRLTSLFDSASKRIDAAFGTNLQSANKLQTALGALRVAGGVFIAFELLKSIVDSVISSADAAQKELGGMVEIANKARNVGVGTDFFQGFSESVKKLGLDASQAEQILSTARGALDVNIGEGDGAKNTSTALDRVKQNEMAGNLDKGSSDALRNADSVEDKERVILGLLDQLQQKGENLAAFDLAGKVFGPDFERALRNGQDAIGAMRQAMDGLAQPESQRARSEEEIAEAQRLSAEQAEQAARVTALWADYQQLVSEYNQGSLDIVLQIKDAFITTAEEVKGLIELFGQGEKILKGWGVDIQNVDAQLAQMLGAGALHDFLKGLGQKTGIPFVLDQNASPYGTLDPNAFKRDQGRPLDIRQDKSKPLPALNQTPPSSPSKDTTDQVATYITSLQKAAAAEAAEASTLGMSNRAKQEAIDLAKGEAAAKERGTALTTQEIASIKASADEYADAKKKIDDYAKSQEALKKGMDDIRETAKGAFSALVDGLQKGQTFGQAFSGVLEKIESKLMDLAESSVIDALLGKTGQTASGGASGGLLSALVSGFSNTGASGSGFQGWMPRFADGGRIRGPGTQSSDSIPAMLSDGEAVIPAKSVSANGALVDALIAGKPMKLAQGGIVGRVAPIGGGNGPRTEIHNYGSPDAVGVQHGKGPNMEHVTKVMVRKHVIDDISSNGPIMKAFRTYTGASRTGR